jgi:hypothetical protein
MQCAVRLIENARRDFAGVGTKRAKIALNKLAIGFPVARALRIALEIEDLSSIAKKQGGPFRRHYYAKKTQFIRELIEIFREQGWVYGKHPAPDTFNVKWIVYFEIPGCEQISFHSNVAADVPVYPKAWDGRPNTTLAKVEAAILLFLGKPAVDAPHESQQSFVF